VADDGGVRWDSLAAAVEMATTAEMAITAVAATW
jgi:hypothetical protein